MLPVCIGGAFQWHSVGATIHLQQRSFFIALGFVLTLSGLLLLWQIFWQPRKDAVIRPSYLLIDIALGSSIGFLSGLVGIGGGILLSPVLNLMRWDSPKKIAALAAFFILVNSIAGLAGQAVGGHLRIEMPVLAVLLAAVFVGGQLGTRINLHAIKPAVVKGLTGVLVCYIGTKLILKYTTGADI
jgi:uncharacterized membrane protein YfcA